MLAPTLVAHLAHAHHRHLRRKQQTIAKELDVLMRKRRSSAQLKLLEELVRCCWSAQGGSSSAPERAQERGQDQGQREATSNERWPREALPHLLQPPASPEPSGSSSCPARLTTCDRHPNGSARRGRRDAEEEEDKAKEHARTDAAGRWRLADLPAQRRSSPRFAVAKAARCVVWLWPWWP